MDAKVGQQFQILYHLPGRLILGLFAPFAYPENVELVYQSPLYRRLFQFVPVSSLVPAGGMEVKDYQLDPTAHLFHRRHYLDIVFRLLAPVQTARINADTVRFQQIHLFSYLPAVFVESEKFGNIGRMMDDLYQILLGVEIPGYYRARPVVRVDIERIRESGADII